MDRSAILLSISNRASCAQLNTAVRFDSSSTCETLSIIRVCRALSSGGADPPALTSSRIKGTCLSLLTSSGNELISNADKSYAQDPMQARCITKGGAGPYKSLQHRCECAFVYRSEGLLRPSNEYLPAPVKTTRRKPPVMLTFL